MVASVVAGEGESRSELWVLFSATEDRLELVGAGERSSAVRKGGIIRGGSVVTAVG